jgi:hypothetical protein
MVISQHCSRHPGCIHLKLYVTILCARRRSRKMNARTISNRQGAQTTLCMGRVRPAWLQKSCDFCNPSSGTRCAFLVLRYLEQVPSEHVYLTLLNTEMVVFSRKRETLFPQPAFYVKAKLCVLGERKRFDCPHLA